MKIKKGDLIILILVIIVAIGWFLKDMMWPDSISDKIALIKVDSQIHSTIPLDATAERKELHLELPDNNHMLIISEKDKIWVEESSCPDKVCVKTGKISNPGQSIVCLPNKTVVYIEGSEKTDIDDGAY